MPAAGDSAMVGPGCSAALGPLLRPAPEGGAGGMAAIRGADGAGGGIITAGWLGGGGGISARAT